MQKICALIACLSGIVFCAFFGAAVAGMELNDNQKSIVAIAGMAFIISGVVLAVKHELKTPVSQVHLKPVKKFVRQP